MKIDLTPKERQWILDAIATELAEQRNSLKVQDGMNDEEIRDCEDELEHIEKTYAKIVEKVGVRLTKKT